MSEDICYNRNYLSQVIVRLDLLNPIEELKTSVPKGISDEIMINFKVAEPRKKIGKELLISPNEVKENKIEVMEWNFYGTQREKRCVIITDAIFLEYKEYNTYEELRDIFVAIIAKFFNKYKDLQGRRLGLRYINKIDLGFDKPLEWADYLNKDLLGLLNFYKEPQFLSRIFHNMEFNFSDYKLKFQFGLHNPDFPAVIKRKQFILDFDAYFEGPQNFIDISKNLDDFHSRIQDLFENCITNKFREHLNEE